MAENKWVTGFFSTPKSVELFEAPTSNWEGPTLKPGSKAIGRRRCHPYVVKGLLGCLGGENWVKLGYDPMNQGVTVDGLMMVQKSRSS